MIPKTLFNLENPYSYTKSDDYFEVTYSKNNAYIQIVLSILLPCLFIYINPSLFYDTTYYYFLIGIALLIIFTKLKNLMQKPVLQVYLENGEIYKKGKLLGKIKGVSTIQVIASSKYNEDGFIDVYLVKNNIRISILKEDSDKYFQQTIQISKELSGFTEIHLDIIRHSFFGS